MKNKSHSVRLLRSAHLAVMMLFLMLTLGNELFDLPHYLFGDPPTTFGQRTGEVFSELLIFAVVLAVQIYVFNQLLKRIRILEGFLPICAQCKKIRMKQGWTQIEDYVAEHSLAKFSHSLCPQCLKELYPDYDIRISDDAGLAEAEMS